MTFSVENKICRIGEGTREIGYRDIHSIMTAYEIEEIVLPESLQVIGDEAFFDWPELKRIRIPAGVRHIGAQAFWGLEKLEELTVPGTVSFVGKHGFCNCPNLTLTVLGKPGRPGWDEAFAANIGKILYRE